MARAPVNKPAAPADDADVVDLVMPDGSTIQAGTGGTKPEGSVHLISASGDGQVVPGESLIVICREPGFRRAGIEHPAVAVYPIDHFGEAELKQLAAEPNLELVAFV
ncbi:hypothetical protein AA12717_0393 [Gluconacetobacter sacchari DSM 12717]|uniref:Mu-like prophage FluMu N-terminal domain-containing protein n=2 Tax=Gluconacetobacter sacchari TaxID=92759 RepID=A0A7W4IBZ2_9PROT|nr:HI1506-related protein [Gluconacetobacter sacchari]MBB2160090.1 hypothetical protein [Gluconacetobacter sacchari]GBQ19914.1 hypothetical protein AA12717_0393 [Gluconacetobacter sacchari DSM 12717]